MTMKRKLELKVEELRAEGVTDIKKVKGISRDCVPYIPTANDQRLNWEAHADLTDQEFWVLIYYDGREHVPEIIPPDECPDEEVDDWFLGIDNPCYFEYLESISKGKIVPPEGYEPVNKSESYMQLDYRERIKTVMEYYRDKKLNHRDRKWGISFASSILENLVDNADRIEGVEEKELWHVIWLAFVAGKEVELRDAIRSGSHQISMRMKTMDDNQVSKTRSPRLTWTKHVEKLLLKNPRLSAREIAKSLKKECICDYDVWREGEITFYSDSPKEGSHTKSFETFESAVSQFKKRVAKKAK